MRRELLMPKLGLTMTEGQLAEWVVPEGGTFKAGSVLFLVETEKVVTEIEAERDGVLLQVVTPVGDTVPVGAVIAYWDDAAATGAAAGSPSAADAKAASAAVPAAVVEPMPRTVAAAGRTVASEDRAQRIVATPLARRLAAQGGVDLSSIRGSGPRGRIKAGDVQAATEALRTAPVESRATGRVQVEPAQARAVPTAPRSAATAPALRATRVEPSAVQAAAARRLTAVKSEVPHFYLSIDAEVSRLLAMREELNAFSAVRLTMNHFIVAALGRALCDESSANRVWFDDAILQFEGSDVGVAVNTERGLFVPVVRDAGSLPLIDVARGTQALVERARAGRLGAPDTSGGAVTVSNAGMFNVAYMTPIINPGQAMILGVGSVREAFRPDAQGQPALRREMGLVLACDHRIIDGVAGLRFLNRVVSYLEQPMKLVLGA